MAQPISNAIAAYRTANARPVAPGGDGPESAPAGRRDFSTFLQEAAEDTMETLRGAEQMTAKRVAGEAGLLDVVTAVNDAQLTLQTVVSIRDRMITAYQDIIRMPI